MLSFLNFLIRWSFYGIFFLVPIVFTGNTSELFEFNKMWITFGFALVIAAAWIGKMVLEKQVKIQRTPLDIFILVFIISQFLSTIFSMDVHTSIWGYYSRFNGGFLSLITYAFLYYAFVTNIAWKDYLKNILVLISSVLFVALWGLPSHFGYDPTCLVFRGTFDVSCWTDAFQPKVRIFSTMGQPDWLAALLVYILPITSALALIYTKAKKYLLSIIFFAASTLFFVDLLYTKARSGFVGIAVAFFIFFLYYALTQRAHLNFLKKPNNFLKNTWPALSLILIYLVITFFTGSPFSQLSFFTPSGVANLFAPKTAPKTQQAEPTQPTSSALPAQEFGGTDSGKIRLFVWQGAWDIFLHNPILGTGVETFAYAYYQYRPAGHNLTSEWDYLYNKAHNEYLNYMATTGALGFGSYMAMLGFAIWVMGKKLFILAFGKNESIEENKNNLLTKPHNLQLISIGLFSGYISILVTNFFGFSVVIMNLLLFLTPAFLFAITNILDPEKVLIMPQSQKEHKKTNELQWIILGAIGIALSYFLIVLLRFWLADTSYALGQNYDHANEYQAAYSYLHDAVATRPSEPVFADELSINDAVLAAALYQQKDTANGQKFAQEAIQTSNNLVQNHPNIITFWKTRVRVMYTLSQIDPRYLQFAVEAIEKAHQLAPTDAKVSYNMALLYGQAGQLEKAASTLKDTIRLKVDYRDAYYALALYDHQLAIDKNGQVTNPELEKEAVDTMHFITKNFDPQDNLKINDTLHSWKEE
ncbi:MAG TPA: O-antigen ligase family protein [Patescibacteria group bacterium]